MKSFLQIGLKIGLHLALRGLGILGKIAQNSIQPFSIPIGYVLHIIYLLQTPLYLETRHARTHQILYMRIGIEVFHGKQVAVLEQHLPAPVNQIIGQAARLAALAPIAAPPRGMATHIALPAIAHTQGSVHKSFGFYLHRLRNGLNLAQRKFARQNQAPKTQRLQEKRFLHTVYMALGAGVKLDRRQARLQQSQILNQQRIHAHIIGLPRQFQGRGHFVFVN